MFYIKKMNNLEELSLINLTRGTYLHEGCQRIGSPMKTVNAMNLMQLEVQ